MLVTIQEVWLVTKCDENRYPNGSPKSSKSNHWAPMADLFEMLLGFEIIFAEYFLGAKSLPEIAKFNNAGSQIEKMVRLVGVGGRGGVLVRRKRRGSVEDFAGEHSVKSSARRSEGGGGLKATASAADPYENSCW